MSYIGKRMLRREDRRILLGKSRYVADIRLPNMLHARILRSPVAHARIKSIDLSAARALPGVAVAIDREDVRHIPRFGHRHTRWPVGDKSVFCLEKALFVGDEIAAVAAETPYLARDAVELIEVDYEELPAVVDPELAMQDGAALVHDELVAAGIIPGNTMYTMKLRAGDMAKAEKEAELTVSGRFYSNQPVCNPLETHGVVASWDEINGEMTIWTSTQGITIVRDGVADLLGIPARKVHVIVPDVGGGFGAKVGLFAHELITCILARKTGRPVSLILDRTEELTACTSRCAQVRYAELMLTREGRFVGWREKVIQDQGAYAHAGPSVMQLGTELGMLPYKIPNVQIDGFDIYTNKNPGSAYRGFGVPQAAFVRDSLLHMAAKKLGVEPEYLMRLNMVKGEECPITLALGQKVDSTGVDLCLEKVVSEAAKRGWKKGLWRGMGYGTTLKHSSCRHPRMDYDHDTVRISMQGDGGVLAETAATHIGQGNWTTLAQIVADQLGMDIDNVSVTGHSSAGPRGFGTWGSRTITITGNALVRACDAVKARILPVAAHLLEAHADELEFADNGVRMKTAPTRKLSLRELITVMERQKGRLPPGMEAGPVEVVASYDSPTTLPDEDGVGNMSMTYSAAAHACWLEVDPGTGKVTILDYIMAEDAGVAINPLIVEGQHQGAVAMAISQVLFEGLRYDEQGQLLNGNYRDYYTALATDIPDLSQVHDCGVPSKTTLLGQKGAGESGNVPALAAVANAIEEATGIRFTEMPITPEKILLALAAREGDAA
jgi:carbon-monoxide dehydrogenase large subunit